MAHAYARFETFSMVDDRLADRRRRLLMGGALALALSMGMGVMSWTANRLGISAVSPPKSFYSVTMEVLEPPPPPGPPPPPPAGGAAADDERDAVPDELVPDEVAEPDVAPTEVVKIDLEARPRVRATVPGSGSGGPVGRGPGIPGGTGTKCPLPPCLGTEQVVIRPPVPHPEPTKPESVEAPIKSVMATSVFTPDPDRAKLSRTSTGRTHRSPGKSTISFCIGGDGKTFDVRVRRGFRGDAEVDEICRQTVSKWRFSPQKVAGKARTTCSVVTFDIRFE